jgi:hypothetical protein
MVVNDNAGNLTPRVALRFFASRLAPTIVGFSSLLAVQKVCKGDSGAACERAEFTEGGKFVGTAGFEYRGGELAHLASPTICAALGVTTAIGGVVCVAAIVGIGALVGTKAGGMGGEQAGEILYEKNWP